tara:strand:- start:133 stop:429 length:297 start_codon:yes stop_codon:yes gene_type:complete
MRPSITAIEKGVNTLAKKLEAKGYTICEIDKFVDGTKGGNYGGSYVELTVSNDDLWESYKFLANGYDRFGKWSEMRDYCLSDLDAKMKLLNPANDLAT